jgi:hypothetical protein
MPLSVASMRHTPRATAAATNLGRHTGRYRPARWPEVGQRILEQRRISAEDHFVSRTVTLASEPGSQPAAGADSWRDAMCNDIRRGMMASCPRRPKFRRDVIKSCAWAVAVIMRINNAAPHGSGAVTCNSSAKPVITRSGARSCESWRAKSLHVGIAAAEPLTAPRPQNISARPTPPSRWAAAPPHRWCARDAASPGPPLAEVRRVPAKERFFGLLARPNLPQSIQR